MCITTEKEGRKFFCALTHWNVYLETHPASELVKVILTIGPPRLYRTEARVS